MELRINKKMASLFVAGSLVFCQGCGEANFDNVSLDEIFSNDQVKAITTMDEEVKSGDLAYDKVFSIVDKAEQLEEAIKIYEMIGTEDYSKVNLKEDLSTKERDEALEADIDEIQKLKAMTEDRSIDSENVEKRLSAIKKLALINKNNNDFIEKEGFKIAKEFLNDSIKGSIADEVHTSSDDVKVAKTVEKGKNFISIKVKDNGYIVKENNKPMWNGINYEHFVDSIEHDDNTMKERVKICKEALNCSKNVILSGTNVEDNRIERQYSNLYIRSKILKR